MATIGKKLSQIVLDILSKQEIVDSKTEALKVLKKKSFRMYGRSFD